MLTYSPDKAIVGSDDECRTNQLVCKPRAAGNLHGSDFIVNPSSHCKGLLFGFDAGRENQCIRVTPEDRDVDGAVGEWRCWAKCVRSEQPSLMQWMLDLNENRHLATSRDVTQRLAWHTSVETGFDLLTATVIPAGGPQFTPRGLLCPDSGDPAGITTTVYEADTWSMSYATL